MKLVIDPLIPEMPKQGQETSEIQEYLWAMQKRAELIELLTEQKTEQNNRPKEN